MFGLMVNMFGMMEDMFTRMVIGRLPVLVMCGLQDTGFRKEMVGIGKEGIGNNPSKIPGKTTFKDFFTSTTFIIELCFLIFIMRLSIYAEILNCSNNIR